MVVGAALGLFVTATVGAAVLGFWDHPERRRIDRRSFGLGVLHVCAAAFAVVAWVIYLIGRASGLGRAALGLLVATAAIGVATFVSTWRGDRSSRYSAPPDPVPTGVLVVHGAAAIVAITLALLTVTA